MIRVLGATTFASLLLLCVSAASVNAEESAHVGGDGFFDEFVDAMIHGKASLNVNFRWENAKIDGLDTSNAATVRTRLGYGTKPLHGVSGFLEFENVASPASGSYFDGVEAATGESIVADPEVIEANRFWLMLDKKEWGGSKLKVGRQRIKLDDDRWVGNVGWRQNEQTYDAVRMETHLGHDDLLVQYIYSWENNRIFGDQGPANRRDYGMKTHLVNVSYNAAKALKATVFAYLIDANDPFAANSSHTYGFRATGKMPVSDALVASYEASWAFQSDAGDNAADYEAHYYHLAAGMKVKSIGVAKGRMGSPWVGRWQGCGGHAARHPPQIQRLRRRLPGQWWAARAARPLRRPGSSHSPKEGQVEVHLSSILQRPGRG